MEHQNCCTDLRHPEHLAACCPYSSVHGKLVVQHPSRTKKVGKLPPLRSFSFLTLRHGLGRRIGGGTWSVSKVALAMHLDGDLKALRAYHAGNRNAPRVVSYFEREGLRFLLK
jgi:hypothetical protein